ncbi:MIP/aquaporin family protein [Raineyella sp. LH-20]|uniref:MIP/aquaporin family protein n=1 Tax=Raineyella sp. LH-20 TaxID=3081204 RepID=UPI00295572FB|nr:MIP/aquaporin family protein [Raineyella sp. LH-20]WOP18525.1 MIP/aquaporin family protein [Raineyella sp. LH-20]
MPLSSIFLSELVGTAALTLLGCGVVASHALPHSKGNGGGWVLITFGWGLAVFVGVYAAFASGGHLNPAVTLGLAIAGRDLAPGVPPTAAAVATYLAAQLTGAFLGAVACWLVYHEHFKEEAPAADKLGVFATGPAIRRYGWNFVSEFIGTFVLVGWVLVSGKTPAELGPLAVASVVTVIGMSLGGPTGYAINPVRDLGPRLAHAILPIPGKGSSDWAYAWVPILAPLAGGAVAALTMPLIPSL